MIEDAQETIRAVKEITLKLLSEPMSEEQKEMILQLYKLTK